MFSLSLSNINHRLSLIQPVSTFKLLGEDDNIKMVSE